MSNLRSFRYALVVRGVIMGGCRARRYGTAAFRHQVPQDIGRRLRLFLAQFLIVALEGLLDEPVDRLAGAPGQRVGQIAGLAAADGKLGFGHGFLIVLSRQMRSEEHTSELQSLMRITYAVFC